MSSAIVPAQQSQVATQTREYSREEVDVIRATVARGASDAQLALFLNVCRSRGLDPFSRQVHWSPQGAIIVGIDGLRAIADRTGCYVPGPISYEYDNNGKLAAATAVVRKLVAGAWHDVAESAHLEEFQGGSPVWRKMPRVMLGKCAESRALRRAFPADLSGLYSPEEMEQAGVAPVGPAEPVRVVTAQRAEATRPAPATVTVMPPPVQAAAPAAVLVPDVVDAEEVSQPVSAAPAPAVVKSSSRIDGLVDALRDGSIADARRILENGRKALSLSDDETVSAFNALLARCNTPAECNDAAQSVVTWKKSGAASDSLIESLRANYLARKSAVAPKVEG